MKSSNKYCLHNQNSTTLKSQVIYLNKYVCATCQIIFTLSMKVDTMGWNSSGQYQKVLIWPKKWLFSTELCFLTPLRIKHFVFGPIQGLEIRMLLQKWVQPFLQKDQDVNSWPHRLTTYDMFITAHYYTWQWQKIKWFWNFK